MVLELERQDGDNQFAGVIEINGMNVGEFDVTIDDNNHVEYIKYKLGEQLLDDELAEPMIIELDKLAYELDYEGFKI